MKLMHRHTISTYPRTWQTLLVAAIVLMALLTTAAAATFARSAAHMPLARLHGLAEAASPDRPAVATLAFAQTSYTMAVNTELTVDLWMNDAASVAGYEARLDFDPAYLQIVSVTLGPLLASTGRTAQLLGPQQDAPGQVYIGGYTYGEQPGVSGSGLIAQITLRALAVGQPTINLSNPLVVTLDGSGNAQAEPASVQGAQVTITPPLAATLASFEAAQEGSGVAVTWTTVSETGNLGFNLLRSDAPDGLRRQVAFVPSQAPGAAQGASYRWLDGDVASGATYFYWLEAVSTDGGTTLHGPVSVEMQTPTAVTVGGFTAKSE